MDGNRTIEALEEEVKLLKGEMKQSLASVRDYLLNMELPSSEFATVLAALGGENDTKLTLDGGLMSPPGAGTDEKGSEEDGDALPEETVSEEHEFGDPGDEFADEEGFTPDDPMQDMLEGEEPGDETGEFDEDGQPRHGGADDILSDGQTIDELGEEGEDALEDLSGDGEEDELEESLDELDDELEDSLEDELDTGLDEEAEPELFTEEELPMERVKVSSEVEQSIPKVNLLANLIAWVARAKRDIGHDQIPTLLEVYGISGHLSPELKDIILHLADITQEQEDPSAAEIWSQTLSSLHGVLTGGDAPLFPLKPFWGEEGDLASDEEEVDETEVEKVSDQPVKLKLVFPGSDGKGKEFCIDLAPETVED